MINDLVATVGAEGRLTDSGAENLAIWLGFIGVMFTAGVGVIIAALNRGRKELHGDHENVALMLRDIKSTQGEFTRNIGDIKRSITKVHERLDIHLEHHNEHQEGYRGYSAPRVQREPGESTD